MVICGIVRQFSLTISDLLNSVQLGEDAIHRAGAPIFGTTFIGIPTPVSVPLKGIRRPLSKDRGRGGVHEEDAFIIAIFA